MKAQRKTAQLAVGRPQQSALPLIGHGLQLGRRPLEFFAELYQQPEPVVEIGLGPKRAYVLTSPDLALRVMRGKEAHSVGKGEYFKSFRAVLGEGLATSEEPKHMKHRRLMQPSFHRDNVARYIGIMQEHTDRMINGWSDGQVVHLEHDLRDLSIRIAAKSLFSSDLGDAIMQETTRAFPVIMNEIPKRSLVPFLAKVPLRNRAFNNAVAKLFGLVDEVIAEYRAGGHDYGDMVSMLMAARFDDGTGLTDAELRDEVLTIYSAGMETSANAMAFAWYEITKQPAIRSKLEAEVTQVLAGGPVTAENIRDLVYTEKIVAETLRRYCPSWLNMREVITEFTIDGITFPVGMPLVFSAYALHNDARHFPDPEVFDPERWTMEYRKKVTRAGIFQPFGAGKHTCLGEPFAWFEGVTVLANMASRLWTEPASTKPVHPVPQAALAINELPMRVHLREHALGAAG